MTVLPQHTDRVKKIETLGSPHEFLSASEDGSVRQHDLRAAPGHGSAASDSIFNAPPGIGLYSISVSPLAPHLMTVSGDADHVSSPHKKL